MSIAVEPRGNPPQGLAGTDDMRRGRGILKLIERRIRDGRDATVSLLTVNDGRTPDEQKRQRRQERHENATDRIQRSAGFDSSRRLRLVCSTHQRASQWKDYAPPPGALEGPRLACTTADEVPTPETPAIHAGNGEHITGMVDIITFAAAGSSRRRAPQILQ